MAVALAAVTGANRVEGNKRVRVWDLTFSGNYATGGEALTAATVGLKVIFFVRFSGPAMSTDLATANPVAYNFATSKVVSYESGGSAAALIEKDNAEAYATGSHVRAEFVGY